MRRLLLLAVCFAATFTASADELPAVPLFRFGIIADGPGNANLVTADITGDGKPEIIACSAGSPFALEHRDGAYPQRWFGPWVNCTGVAAGDADGDGATDIIVAGTNGLLIFDPRGLGAAPAQVSLPPISYDVAFGNVDFDAAPEIVVAGATVTYVYDAATLELQWTATGHGGRKVLIGDVDGDARNEIVLSGGSILDAGNETLKWGYLGGFYYLAVGNVDADAKAEIVFTEPWSNTVTVLNGDTMTTSTVTGFDIIEQVAVADADGDGTNEVIAGNNQWGSISGRRASDSTLVWNIYSDGHGCGAIAVADVDDDGVREVLWTASWANLYIGNPLTETEEWSTLDLHGALYVTTGDVDGDGRTELAVLSTDSDGPWPNDGAVVKIFDALTGAEERHINIQYSYGRSVAFAQLDADPAMEIAVELESNIRVYDGVTGTLEWTSPQNLSGMLIANVDGDAVSEIIAYYNQLIVVLHGASNIIQSSRSISGGRAYAVGDVTGDGVPEVIAANSSTLYVLSSTLTTQAETAFSGTFNAAATANEGGRIAVLSSSTTQLHLFDKTLAPQWTCTRFASQSYHDVSFAAIAGQPRVLSTDGKGILRAMPITGNACPAFDSRQMALATQAITADVNGDGRTELVASTLSFGEISLIGLPGETRGDVNGDSVVASNDIDNLVDYLFGETAAMSTTGDANADERLSGEDAFALIHYEYGGGSLPE